MAFIRGAWIALAALSLAGCHRAPAPSDSPPEPITPGAAIEQAAIASGVIPDLGKLAPEGLYQRRHEGGVDSLCLMPKGDDGRRFRFGLQVELGDEARCAGQGIARHAGEAMILDFQGGSRCTIIADYQGDQIVFPGMVDMACEKLCEGRGNLAGVSLPRAASGSAAAEQARNTQGDPLCD